MGSIKYEFAFDENKNLIHIDDAIKKKKYLFPNYDNVFLIPHKGEKNRNHFKTQVFGDFEFRDNEGPLHLNCKYIIYLMLKEALEKKKPFYINSYICSCGETHKINLIDGISKIFCDNKFLGPTKPDILLQGKNKNKVIEIIDSHDIEENTFNYYKKNEVEIFKIYVSESYFTELKELYFKKRDFINESKTFSKKEIESKCENFVQVKYFQKEKNIFPCFKNYFEESYKSKIEFPGQMPCLSCKYFKGFKDKNLINCSNPIGKEFVIKEKNKNSYFNFKFYFSSKKISPSLVMNSDEFLIKLSQYMKNDSIDFFEYSSSDSILPNYYVWSEILEKWKEKYY